MIGIIEKSLNIKKIKILGEKVNSLTNLNSNKNRNNEFIYDIYYNEYEGYDDTLCNDNDDNIVNTINRCYQCIFCPPMFFQSKKKSLSKRLWRLRVSTTNSSSNNTNHNVDDMEQDHMQQSLVPCRRNIDIGRGEGSHLMMPNITENCTTGSSTSFITNCCTSSQTTNSNTDLTEQNLLRLCRALVDKLRERQLETLCQSIESIQYNSQQQMLQQQQQHYHRNNPNNHNSNHHQQYQTATQQQLSQQIVTDCVLVQRTTIGGEQPHLIACRLWRWMDIIHSSELKRIPSCPNEKDPVYICCNPAHWSRQCKTGKNCYY